MLGYLLLFLLTAQAQAVSIFQGATASLSSTPSLVTYTTKLTPLTAPQMVLTSSVEDPTPRSVNIAPNPDDTVNYQNGIYTCPVQGTYSVGASLSIGGTISVLSTLTIDIELSTNAGATWTTLRTVTSLITTGAPKGSTYNAFLVPCPAAGKIRIMASTSVLLPSLSNSPPENTLSISRIQ